MYFDTCKTPEEAKSLYKTLARQHHPDMGGDTATMQAINAEYAAWVAGNAKTGERARQAQAHKEGRKTAADFHNLDEVAEVLRVKIEAALNLGADVEVELCGLWVWVTGNTKPHRQELGREGLGFKWAPEKQAWYFPGVPSFNRQRRTLEEIREMHGSTRFTRQDQPAEEAAPALRPA